MGITPEINAILDRYVDKGREECRKVGSLW